MRSWLGDEYPVATTARPIYNEVLPARRFSSTAMPERKSHLRPQTLSRTPTRRLPGFRKSFAAFLLLLAAAPQLCFADSLDSRISAIIDKPAANRAFWGVKIVDLGSGRSIYESNPGKLFVPASNAKLFATALGLTRLGPDYRYTTSVVSSKQPDASGRLSADVVLVGGGDPNLSSRILPYNRHRAFDKNQLLPITELAQQIVDAGIQRIEGNIIGDDSRYVWQRYPDGWSAEDTSWGYGAPVSALAFNDNLVEVGVLPGTAAGAPARLSMRPTVPYYSVENRVRTAPTRTVAQALTLDREPGSRVLSIWGQISIRSRGRTFSVAVDDPALFAALALQTELERLGVAVEGKAVSRHAMPYEFASLSRVQTAKPTSPAIALAAIQSASLTEALRVMNKESQNLHAEMLLREVGLARRGVGSFEAALAELEDFLREAGLQSREFHFSDGSGLSRKNLVSPQATVDLLRYMWQSSNRQPFREALPLAGEDGTLDWRFANTPAKGLIRAKTGTLSHVTALSGYATTMDGRDLAFSILVNNFGVSSSYIRNLVDKICVAMVTSASDETSVSTAAASAGSNAHGPR